MNLKTIIFLLIFSVLCSYASIAQPPYNKMPKYPKKSDVGIVMAQMIDEVGYKYYWATEGLLNDEQRKTFNSNNLPRLFLKGAYQMSESLINYTSQKSQKKKLEKLSFSEYRKNTLLNLKEASANLIENDKASLFLDWDLFMKSIAVSDAYCDEIIEFRESNGQSYQLPKDFTEKKPSDAKILENSIGADGLTNEQWMKITERGGGPDAWDKIATTRKGNQRIIVESRKEKRGTVSVGELETIEESFNFVDGQKYIYFYDPPEQLSFLFSNDKEYIEGIINWIIYINSGNSVKLSDMFRVGLDIVISNDTSDEETILHDRYRDTSDKEENKLRLEISEKYFEGNKFSDVIIQKVAINTNNQIEFVGKHNAIDDLSQSSQQIILLLKNIDGDLLDRMKVNINQMREGLFDYDESIMLLKD